MGDVKPERFPRTRWLLLLPVHVINCSILLAHHPHPQYRGSFFTTSPPQPPPLGNCKGYCRVLAACLTANTPLPASKLPVTPGWSPSFSTWPAVPPSGPSPSLLHRLLPFPFVKVLLQLQGTISSFLDVSGFFPFGLKPHYSLQLRMAF